MVSPAQKAEPPFTILQGIPTYLRLKFAKISLVLRRFFAEIWQEIVSQTTRKGFLVHHSRGAAQRLPPQHFKPAHSLQPTSSWCPILRSLEAAWHCWGLTRFFPYLKKAQKISGSEQFLYKRRWMEGYLRYDKCGWWCNRFLCPQEIEIYFLRSSF